jgi:hypothetical protein
MGGLCKFSEFGMGVWFYTVGFDSILLLGFQYYCHPEEAYLDP